jgi:hypothetical protein
MRTRVRVRFSGGSLLIAAGGLLAQADISAISKTSEICFIFFSIESIPLSSQM